jgi:hypothetical protein
MDAPLTARSSDVTVLIHTCYFVRREIADGQTQSAPALAVAGDVPAVIDDLPPPAVET